VALAAGQRGQWRPFVFNVFGLDLKTPIGERDLVQQMCVAGKRCCPPEECGGPQRFAELVQALQDSSYSSHDEACEWLDVVP
jgi:hypothetical protein